MIPCPFNIPADIILCKRSQAWALPWFTGYHRTKTTTAYMTWTHISHYLTLQYFERLIYFTWHYVALHCMILHDRHDIILHCITFHDLALQAPLLRFHLVNKFCWKKNQEMNSLENRDDNETESESVCLSPRCRFIKRGGKLSAIVLTCLWSIFSMPGRLGNVVGLSKAISAYLIYLYQ